MHSASTRTAGTAKQHRPSTRRSSSTSVVPRKFACHAPNCGKSFTRAEHLQRHELNHRDSVSTCMRCRAHFSRPDLLDRHMERHAQKDREAGGEGLGVLVTRKRCWRDENGNITAKRPASSLAAAERANEARRLKQRHTSEESSAQGSISTAMSSPEPSTSSKENTSFVTKYAASKIPHDNRSGGEAYAAKCFVSGTNSISSSSGDDEPTSATRKSSFSSLRSRSDYILEQLPPLSQPAGSSFVPGPTKYSETLSDNATQKFTLPIPMVNNYNWLFEDIKYTQQGSNVLYDDDAEESDGTKYEESTAQEPQAMLTPSAEFGAYTAQQRPWREPVYSPELLTVEMNPYADLHLTHSQPSPLAHQYHKSSQFPYRSFSNSRDSSLDRFSHSPAITNMADSTNAHYHPQDNRISLYPLPSTVQAEYELYPKIEEHTRIRLIDLLFTVTTQTSCALNPQDRLLGLPALRNFYNLFFSRFNSSYPLLNRRCFDPNTAPPLLLISMLILGATYADEEDYSIAILVHDIVRSIMVSSDYFRLNSEPWILQTVLLIEVFGKLRAGIRQHEIAHLVQGLLTNLVRWNNQQPPRSPVSTGDLETDWRMWIGTYDKL